jgi:hypothetical protein
LGNQNLPHVCQSTKECGAPWINPIFYCFYIYRLYFIQMRALWLAKQVFYRLSHTSSPFCSDYFGGGVLWTTWPRWSGNFILWISVTQVVRITGVSHWDQVEFILYWSWLYPEAQGGKDAGLRHNGATEMGLDRRFWCFSQTYFSTSLPYKMRF